jgi:hypothetical protein
VTLTGEATGQALRPFETVTATADGSFTANFLLEKTPAGEELRVGRYELIARSGTTEVRLPFQVEVRRPLGNPGGPG